MRASYWSWRHDHPREVEDAATVWAEAWRRGSWDAIRRNSNLGLTLLQVVERLEELARLYADVDAAREAERGSPLWKS